MTVAAVVLWRIGWSIVRAGRARWWGRMVALAVLLACWASASAVLLLFWFATLLSGVHSAGSAARNLLVSGLLFLLLAGLAGWLAGRLAPRGTGSDRPGPAREAGDP